jgi:hypothetical protein
MLLSSNDVAGMHHLLSIPLVTHLPLFQGNCWFRFLSPKRRKWLWVYGNRSQQAGRTIFLTVMVLRLVYKALELTKGTDLTQYPQLILTSMMAKDTS